MSRALRDNNMGSFLAAGDRLFKVRSQSGNIMGFSSLRLLHFPKVYLVETDALRSAWFTEYSNVARFSWFACPTTDRDDCFGFHATPFRG